MRFGEDEGDDGGDQANGSHDDGGSEICIVMGLAQDKAERPKAPYPVGHCCLVLESIEEECASSIVELSGCWAERCRDETEDTV